jgi:Kef-type K+ transport system membrane component KefB/Ca2+-binding EF-hand superfamily protein
LIGEIGLIFLILGAGIELDVAQLRQTGTRAVAIAFVGSMLPLITGIGIAYATDSGLGIKGALAVGASFAPTSSGVAASALSSGGIYDTPVGRLIMASCVVDDIIGLILLSTFQVLVKDDPKIIEYFIPLLSSCGFLLVLGVPAVTFLPRFIEQKFLPIFPKHYRDMAMFGLLFSMLMGYLQLLNYTKASYLTGAFLAGASFSQVDGAYEKFKHNTDSIKEWLLRIFFAATIGFQVPIELFREPYVIGLGFALWASCVAIKSLVAFFVPHFEETEKGAIYDPYKRDLLVTGLSMSCRGEFSFIISGFALSEGVIEPKMYASVVLAVLISAITSPFMLLRGINYFKTLQAKQLIANDPLKCKGDGTMPLHLHIHLQTKGVWSLLEILQTEMHDLGLVVEDYRTTNTRGIDPTIISDIYVRDTKTTIAIPTLRNQKAIEESMHRIDLDQAYLVRTNSIQDIRAMNTLNEGTKEGILMIAMKMEEDAIIETRAKEIQSKLFRDLSDFSMTELDVEQWNPWDWTAVLDKMAFNKRANGEELDLKFFMNLFNIVDTDGSGTFGEEDLLFVLKGAGMSVTRERLAAMIAVVDEEGNGQISVREWEKAITSYLAQKKKPRKMSLADISVSLSLRDRLGGSRHYLDIINEDIGIDMDEGTNSIRPGGNLDVVTEDLLTDIQATDSGDWNDPFPIQSEVSRNGVEDMA